MAFGERAVADENLAAVDDVSALAARGVGGDTGFEEQEFVFEVGTG